MGPIVSIIMPAYNAFEHIGDAINSVLDQTYRNWELLIVNDGSTDTTEREILKFEDRRIKYFKQRNKGVSAARNLSLANMNGEYFCFLDADDVYPPNSLESRLEIFDMEDKVHIVDGKVEVRDMVHEKLIRIYRPGFRGNVLPEYVRLNERCFFGPSCMIKRSPGKPYRFKEGLTHGEDLLFYISIADEGLYSYTNDLVMIYRSGNRSAMSDLPGLEKGYFDIYHELKKMPAISPKDLEVYKKRITSIMFKSYLRKGRPYRAALVLKKSLFT